MVGALVEHHLAQLGRVEQRQLVGLERELKAHAPVHGVERQLPRLEAQGVAVKVHRAAVGKFEQGQHLARPAAELVGAGRVLVNQPRHFGDRINGVAHHLRTQLRKFLTQGSVMQVVQGHPVPDPGLLHLRRQRIAHLRKHRPQLAQACALFGAGVEGNADQKVHIGRNYSHILYEVSRLAKKPRAGQRGACQTGRVIGQ